MSWGISYYLIGAFGESMIAELGWSRTTIYGGFSLALLVMALASPLAGRLIDRHGGAVPMIAGSLATALACAMLAIASDVVLYCAAWVVLGVAMRLTLYDAAFAAFARSGGMLARRPMAQITLLGGLASSVFWPIGYALADAFGWRNALFVYAVIAVAVVPLHLTMPKRRFEAPAPVDTPAEVALPRRTERRVSAALYALIMALASFLNSGMSAHMIAILTGLGVAASLAVWISTLRGIGQSLARLAEVLLGRNLHPLSLNIIATLLLPLSFVAGFASGLFAPAAMFFAFAYGAGNGLLTITRGTVPLVLFGHRNYGGLVGWLLMPSFALSAVAPVAYAAVIEAEGQEAGLWLSVGVATATVAAAIGLMLLNRKKH